MGKHFTVKIKMVARFDSKGKLLKTTPMDAQDVKSYFNNIAKGSKEGTKILKNGKKSRVAYHRKPGDYCERCGINIGIGYTNEVGHIYKGFYIGNACLIHKQSDEPENTPDLEDIERFGVSL